MSEKLQLELLINLTEAEFTKLCLQPKGGITQRDIVSTVTYFEQEVLAKIKAKDGDKSERYLFYKRVLDIMYTAMVADEEITFWKDVAVRTKMDAEVSRQTASIYYNELMKYKALQEVILQGNLDKYIEEVKKRTQP